MNESDRALIQEDYDDPDHDYPIRSPVIILRLNSSFRDRAI